MVAVVARAAWLQAVRGDALGALAVRHQQFEVPLPLPRATIFDRGGRALATSEQAMTIGAIPRLVRDPAALAAALAPVLGRDRAVIEAQLRRRDRDHVDVARQVDPDLARRIQRRNLGDGALDFRPEERRVYPEGSVGAQVVGFAGLDGTGLGGVELWLNRQLTSTAGSDTVVKDLHGQTLEVLSHKPGVPGRNVTLTLDRDIQAQVEDVVNATRQMWQAKSAT